VKLRPTFLQALTIGFGGAVVAFFGCLGAIAGFSTNASGGQALGVLGGAVFVAGVIAVLVGGLIFVIATFNAIFGRRDVPQPPDVTPPPTEQP
jgi:hypothetical protein